MSLKSIYNSLLSAALCASCRNHTSTLSHINKILSSCQYGDGLLPWQASDWLALGYIICHSYVLVVHIWLVSNKWRILLLTLERCGQAWLGLWPTWRLLIYLHLMAAKTEQRWGAAKNASLLFLFSCLPSLQLIARGCIFPGLANLWRAHHCLRLNIILNCSFQYFEIILHSRL